MASSNRVLVAAAGSGKTSYLLTQALEDSSKRSLVITYTNENLGQIKRSLWERTQGRPSNVDTMTLFEFLLRECVKPYQTFKTGLAQIRSVNFITDKNDLPRVAKSDFRRYYFDAADNVYSDMVSDLACVLNEASAGKVIKRLEAIYDKILVDEVQDLAGWDLEFVDLLFQSEIQIVLVGDPRQAVYTTNRSNKNSQFRGVKLVDWIIEREQAALCERIDQVHSHRCVQPICNFADSLFPKLPKTESRNAVTTAHDGVFLVHEDQVELYRQAFNPQELRWNRLSGSAREGAKNFGQVKGLSFERVLVHPTKAMSQFIETGQELKQSAAAKFYVATTRARQSVAIVLKSKRTKSALPIWNPGYSQEESQAQPLVS